MATKARIKPDESMAQSDLHSTNAVDRLAQAEALAKIASLIAIPVVLAVVGWLVQDKLATRTVSKDYVQLAVSILSQPKQADIDPALRDWAVELLNDNSPIKFSTKVATQLRSGVATLPVEQSENLLALARSYVSAGDFAKAESALRETLALQEKQYGREHPAVADTLANLGALYLSSGKYSAAEALYKRAIAIEEKTLGPENSGIARLLSGLASVYEAEGNYGQAQALRKRADAIYRRAGPKQ
jgi:tetratricopeptide (TPR) repeat protein